MAQNIRRGGSFLIRRLPRVFLRAASYALSSFTALMIVGLGALREDRIIWNQIVPSLELAAEALLRGSAGGDVWDVKIGDFSMRWNVEEDIVLLHGAHIALHEETDRHNHGQNIEIENLQALLRLSALLEGSLEPLEVVVSRASSFLEKGKREGSDAARRRRGGDALTSFTQFSTDVQREASFSWESLKTLHVKEFRFGTERKGESAASWDLGLSLAFQRKGGVWTGRVEGLDAQNAWQGYLRGRDLSDGGSFLAASFSAMPIRVLSPFLPELNLFLQMQSRVTGKISGELDSKGRLALGEANLQSEGEGVISFPVISSASHKIGDIKLHALYDSKKRAIEFKRLNYRALGGNTGISGAISYEEDAGGVSQIHVKMGGEDIKLYVPGAAAEIVPAKTFQMDVLLDLRRRVMNIKDFALEIEEGSASLKGAFMEGLSLPGSNVELLFENLPFTYLPRLLPKQFNPRAHQWVSKNVLKGDITQARFFLQAPRLSGEDASPQAPTLGMKMEFRDMDFRYAQALPPLEGAQGRCLLERGNLLCEISETSTEVQNGQGKIGLSSASYEIRGLGKKERETRLLFAGYGGAEPLIQWVDNLPGQFLSKRNILAATALGHGTFEADISWDHKARAWLQDTKMRVKVHFENLSLGSLMRERSLPLENGVMDITFTNHQTRLRGEAVVGGVKLQGSWKADHRPDSQGMRFLQQEVDMEAMIDTPRLAALGIELSVRIEGAAPLRLQSLYDHQTGKVTGSLKSDLTHAFLLQPHLGWLKPSGQKALLTTDIAARLGEGGRIDFKDIVFESGETRLAGAVHLDESGRLLRADFPLLQVQGAVRTTLGITRDEEDVVHVKVRAERFDARHALDTLLGGNVEGVNDASVNDVGVIGAGEPELRARPDEGKVRIEGSVAVLEGYGGVELHNLVFSLGIEEDRITALDLEGLLQQRDKFKVSLTPNDKGRHLLIEAEDAGAILRGINLYSGMLGGDFELKADIKIGKDDKERIDGQIFVRNFQILDEGILSEIVEQSSFDQKNNDEGIRFSQMLLPFVMEPNRITFKEGRAVGLAMGVSLNGTFEREAQTLHLRGTLTPAYVINALLDNIPIVGPLFSSRKGEGLLGVTYAVDGPVDKLVIRVNPASALLPGILRRLFEFSRKTPRSPS